MAAVAEAAKKAGLAEENIHQEYFSIPELPDYENHDFSLKIASTGQIIPVAAEQNAADALNEHGFSIEVKCSDGLCGVCQCDYLEGEVEHRDFVLSSAQKKTRLILCQSRAKDKGTTLTLDL